MAKVTLHTVLASDVLSNKDARLAGAVGMVCKMCCLIMVLKPEDGVLTHAFDLLACSPGARGNHIQGRAKGRITGCIKRVGVLRGTVWGCIGGVLNG